MPGGVGLISADILSSLCSETSGCIQNHIQGFSFKTASVPEQKLQDTIHSAFACHFTPTAHSCASSEISCDADNRDLGGQAELRISLRGGRQLSQLKIYGTMPSPSSGSRIRLPRRGSDRSGKTKQKKKHLSNLAIRCQEACLPRPRIHSRIASSRFR